MTPKPILRIAAAVAMIAGLALPVAARPLAVNAPQPAVAGDSAPGVVLASGRDDDILRWRIWRDWRRGEISAAERDIRLKRLERRIYEREHRYERGREFGRRGGNGHGRRALPVACLRRIDGGRHDRRVFGARCLERNGVRTARLPDRCETVIRVGGRWREVYGARCLERAGYRIAGQGGHRATRGPIHPAPRYGERTGSRLVYRNGELHLVPGDR